MSVFRTSFQVAASFRRVVLSVNNLLVHSTVFLKARNPRRFLALPAAVGTLSAAALPLDIKATTSLTHLTHQADRLYESNKLEELYDLLHPYKESDQPELLWRFARSAYTLALLSKTLYKDKVRLLTEGYEAAKHGLELAGNSALAYKWVSILLDEYTKTQGFKERCRQSSAIKDLMIKSAELDASDPVVMYMLGMWYYEIAGLAWYARSILRAAGGGSPHATFEEALTFFEKAEVASPQFYSLNLLMLGKTNYKLGNVEQARIYLQKAAAYPDFTEDDRRAKKEATALLEKLKTKK